MRLITANDIIGHLARWAVQLHPYNEPEGLFEVCKSVKTIASERFTDGVRELPMRWFKDYGAINNWLHMTLDPNPLFRKWNVPRSGHTQQIISSSRFHAPRPEDDIIDLDALIINVARDVWDSAAEFEKKESA